ncbi:hypothetical protein AVEN_153426-1 [Araneus ventricosus]|uniref:Uncharacterized protein n=1 Tax=Araneus ventricosus TaxID=182803 RepID=A0A4Y2EBL4_ARAVE|nr:hypothetical protein AVEN_153426-1 [Araneus ventricosus]
MNILQRVKHRDGNVMVMGLFPSKGVGENVMVNGKTTISIHGKSLPSNASLMVGKRVLQGEAWSDLSHTYGTHDLGDHFDDLATNLATLATNR